MFDCGQCVSADANVRNCGGTCDAEFVLDSAGTCVANATFFVTNNAGNAEALLPCDGVKDSGAEENQYGCC